MLDGGMQAKLGGGPHISEAVIRSKCEGACLHSFGAQEAGAEQVDALGVGRAQEAGEAALALADAGAGAAHGLVRRVPDRQQRVEQQHGQELALKGRPRVQRAQQRAAHPARERRLLSQPCQCSATSQRKILPNLPFSSQNSWQASL